MSVFNVELKKVVDDSYDIEIGYNLKDQLVDDLETGLLGSTKKLAVITDSNVRDLYADVYKRQSLKTATTQPKHWLLMDVHLLFPTVMDIRITLQKRQKSLQMSISYQ